MIRNSYILPTWVIGKCPSYRQENRARIKGLDRLLDKNRVYRQNGIPNPSHWKTKELEKL